MLILIVTLLFVTLKTQHEFAKRRKTRAEMPSTAGSRRSRGNKLRGLRENLRNLRLRFRGTSQAAGEHRETSRRGLNLSFFNENNKPI
jgi:hypothetical protein